MGGLEGGIAHRRHRMFETLGTADSHEKYPSSAQFIIDSSCHTALKERTQRYQNCPIERSRLGIDHTFQAISCRMVHDKRLDYYTTFCVINDRKSSNLGSRILFIITPIFRSQRLCSRALSISKMHDNSKDISLISTIEHSLL